MLLGGSALLAQPIWMNPNRGQWDERIEYAIDLQLGQVYIEKEGFTFFLNDINKNLKHSHNEEGEHEEHKMGLHVIRSKFLNSTWKGQLTENEASAFYKNYFLGNNSSKWKGEVRSYGHIVKQNFYEGIDLDLNGKEGALEYSFIVKPNTSPDVIRIEMEGQDRLTIDEEGRLHIHNRFGEIIESAPKAWTIDEESQRKKEVKVFFELKGNTISFRLPNGYDQGKVLVIDPNLVFSTFSGSTLDNWGMTATPDDAGNTYAGGIAFTGSGSYPTVTGSFDVTYNGGTSYTYTTSNGSSYSLQGFDIAISKFNTNGTNLLFSTYLGGSANEAPHSMVVDSNGDLYVMGVTSSANFPVTTGAFDVTFNGGPNISSNELGYPQGSDLYITHFNSAGTALVASTFMGGTGTDGINEGPLNYNYGDPFRGEIIVDNQFVYVSSTSRSPDFPIVNGFQGTLSGTQDAVIFKMNQALSSLQWSTFFGGISYESGNSLQLSSNGFIYMTGGTTSASLPVSNGVDLVYDGGISDGYIAKFNASTGAFVAGTFVGYTEYDQCFFVQLDLNDDVYVYGQSETAYPISNGVYANPNSGQFIRKYDSNLMNILWTTQIGGGSGHPEISPTAFLVSNCGDIYISGWGGTINTSFSNQAFFSSTNGFQVTSNAYQSVTNGSNFYIAVLGQDAASLKYATFMGGTSTSYNHVDGGTSRFDKSGRIYHAVCGACGGNDFGFTTTPGVWSPTNQSNNCNLAAFKFELSTIEAVVGSPDPVICLPDPVVFNNNSANGNDFYWDFGDGTHSQDVNPSHVYPGPGNYTVTLIVTDTNGCYSPDSVYFDVNIGEFGGGVTALSNPICPGSSVQLEAYGGTTYLWSPAQYLDDPTSATPIATVNQTTDFSVIISDVCGTDTVFLNVPVYGGSVESSNDTSICIGNTVPLFVNGGVSVQWSPPTYLDDPSSSNPISTPTADITYFVEIQTSEGCTLRDTVFVDVFFTPPVPVMPDSLYVCAGSSVDVVVSGGDTYFWYPDNDIDNTTSPSVQILSPTSQYFYCDMTNVCGTVTDSLWLQLVSATVTAKQDTIICPGRSVTLQAEGGISYYWWPSYGLSSVSSSQVSAAPLVPTKYYVIGTDQYGCTSSDSVFVDLYPQAFIQTSPDVYAFVGDEIQLNAITTTSGLITWSPVEYLSCVVCSSPVANPDHNYYYVASYTDINGCSASDTVHIYYDPIIYVPNTFSPNGDEHNQLFMAKGGNISEFKMDIYNRWGERIFTTDDINDGWDGTYKGQLCQDGTYTWKIELKDLQQNGYEYVGHVNVIK